MRPPKYPSLGPMNKHRIPDEFIDDINTLLSEIDRLSEYRDPHDIFDDIISNLSDIEGGD